MSNVSNRTFVLPQMGGVNSSQSLPSHYRIYWVMSKFSVFGFNLKWSHRISNLKDNRHHLFQSQRICQCDIFISFFLRWSHKTVKLDRVWNVSLPLNHRALNVKVKPRESGVRPRCRLVFLTSVLWEKQSVLSKELYRNERRWQQSINMLSAWTMGRPGG